MQRLEVSIRVDNGTKTSFQYKLWSVGNAVRVTNYWIDEDYDPATGPNWTKFTAATAPGNLRNIFDADPDACIDMMFVLDPSKDVKDGGALDNGLLPAGTKPPYYCLGRCKNPPILNTK